jgi:hypothetical protein
MCYFIELGNSWLVNVDPLPDDVFRAKEKDRECHLLFTAQLSILCLGCGCNKDGGQDQIKCHACHEAAVWHPQSPTLMQSRPSDSTGLSLTSLIILDLSRSPRHGRHPEAAEQRPSARIKKASKTGS